MKRFIMRRVVSCIFVFTLFICSFSNAQNIQVGNPNKVQVAFPFFDNVETNSTSSSYWTRDTTIWQIKIANAYSGTQVWAMLPSSGQYNYLTLSSSINLSATSNPYLAFWVKKADGGSGYVSLEASSDGGTTWAAISQPNFNGSAYVHMQVSLANYKSANVLVRIGGYAPYGGTYYVDDIRIDNAPTPQALVLSAPANNGMHFHWGQSTSAYFYRYRVIFSTDQNAVNNYYVGAGVSGHGETKVFDIYNKASLDTTLTDITFTNTPYYGKVYEEDTHNLINQGSDRSDLSTTFIVTAETAPFVETFEGSNKWAADLPWAVTTNDAADPGHSPTHAYEDSPNGNYSPNADNRLVMQVNLAGVTRPVLRFNHRYTYEQGADFGYIEYSGDNVNWTTITGFTGNSAGGWEQRQFDAGILKNNSTGYIRFRTVSNGSTQQDGWHLDDVEIYNNTKTTTLPFFDNVAVDTTSQKLWIAGQFNVKIANDHSGDGQVWALGPAGGQYNYLTLASKINLSGAPNPYISFWVKKADGGGGYVSIEVSNDAGLTWNVLAQPNFNGAQYTWFEASLLNYVGPNDVVRIGCYSPYGGTYYIDDILIDNAPTPHPITLMTPTNNGMRLKWTASTAADFYSYRVVLSTDQNTVNNYFAGAGINGHGETRVIDFYNKSMTDTTITDLTFFNTHYYAKIYELDTQGLINQGSDMVDLYTAFSVTAETAPFVETFEGSTYKWAGDLPWTVTTDDAADPGHSTTHAYEDSPLGNYAPNADRRLELQVNFPAGVTRPVLRFNHRYTYEQGADYGYIEYSGDNANWTTIAGFTGNSAGGWEQRQFDAGILKNNSTGYIRFRTVSNGSTQQDGWHVDDVEIYNNTTSFKLPIVDSVEVDTVSSKYWIAGMWGIKGATAHSGTQVWALPPEGGQYNYITLAGVLNLSPAPKPYVSFWVKKADGGSGYISFEVSNDAGLTWTVIQQPNFNGNNYTNFIYSLGNYRQPNILVRIGAYSPYGNTYLLDDIKIADSTGYTGINDFKGIVPSEFQLSQNYPNPFNPSTVIRYSLPYTSKVVLNVYNSLGQEVMRLKNETNTAGVYEVQFNSSKLPSGIYFYQLTAESVEGNRSFTATKKMILLK
jgi:hypothetical protein